MPAHRGETPKEGSLILQHDSPNLTIEDYAEAPQKMGREAVELFHKAVKGIFEPRLVYDELGIESKKCMPAGK